MKTSARRWLGVAIFAVSLLGVTLLFLLGTPLISVYESHTTTFPNGSATSSMIEFHWYAIALFVAGLAGLLLILIPGREKSNV
jgi:hypothetical protein